MLQDPEKIDDWSDEVWATTLEEAERQCRLMAGDDLTIVLNATQKTTTLSRSRTYKFICWFRSGTNDIRVLSYPPAKGEHYLSINLALVNPAVVWAIAKELGLNAELVQITGRLGTEVHALLFYEQTEGEELLTTALDRKIDELADVIPTDAIRHTYGGRIVGMA
jgi:hypothetical protein